MGGFWTVVLAVLGVVANWTNGVREDGKSLTPAGRFIMASIILFTFLALRDANRDKTESQAKVDAMRAIMHNSQQEAKIRRWRETVMMSVEHSSTSLLFDLILLERDFKKSGKNTAGALVTNVEYEFALEKFQSCIAEFQDLVVKVKIACKDSSVSVASLPEQPLFSMDCDCLNDDKSINYYIREMRRIRVQMLDLINKEYENRLQQVQAKGMFPQT